MIHQQLVPALDSKRVPLRPSRCGEYYESLLMRLYDSSNSRQSLLPTVGITSCVHGEGVSTVAANLAIHASRALTDPVLLLEVAAGCSSIDRVFNVDSSAGLAEMLSGRSDTAECIQPTRVHNLSVLGEGARGDSWCDFQPRSISRVLQQLRDQFAFVVVDLPPANASGPCLAVASQLDGVLLTIEAERVSSQATQRAKQELLHVGANLLGVILNKRRQYISRWLSRRR